jgi:hypothetical protein
MFLAINFLDLKFQKIIANFRTVDVVILMSFNTYQQFMFLAYILCNLAYFYEFKIDSYIIL